MAASLAVEFRIRVRHNSLFLLFRNAAKTEGSANLPTADDFRSVAARAVHFFQPPSFQHDFDRACAVGSVRSEWGFLRMVGNHIAIGKATSKPYEYQCRFLSDFK